jgi:hypothetical protein
MKRFLWLFIVLIAPVTLRAESRNVILEPAVQKITFSPEGSFSLIEPLSLANTTDTTQQYRVRAIEFTELDKNGGNIFLGQLLEEGKGFGDAPWVRFPEERIVLAPGEKKVIHFSLIDSDALTPGAHYGALLLEAERPEGGDGFDPSKIFLRQIAASLIYLNKQAGATTRIEGEEIRFFKKALFLPDTAILRVKNTGNTYVEPHGYAVIRDPFGREIEKKSLNEEGKILFPGQSREIKALFSKSAALFPGKYRVEIFYRISEEDYQRIESSYWEISFGGAFLLIVSFLGLWYSTFSFLKKKQRIKKKN